MSQCNYSLPIKNNSYMDNETGLKQKGLKRKREPQLSAKTSKIKKSKQESDIGIDTVSDEPTGTPEINFTWKFEDVITDELDLPTWAVRNVITLLDEDNTIPFIARYRKEMTNNMEVKNLIDIKESYENLKSVQTKATNAIKAIYKLGKMNALLLTSFLKALTLTDVEHLYAPYKTGKKKTLAERARQLGLEPLALNVLNGGTYNMQEFIKPATKGLSNLTEIQTGILNILADIISKDQDVLQITRNCLQTARVMLESCKSRSADKEIDTSKEDSKPGHHNKENSKQKFELYYQFSQPVKFIKPHQVLAINRGESLKILSVKVIIPENVKTTFLQFCDHKYKIWNRSDDKSERTTLLENCCNDAWNRLVEPLLCRLIKSDLTKNAEKASVEVFATNLRQLLLTSPVKGAVVTGIDPGFRNGCKVAIISSEGNILHTDVFYLPQIGAKNKSKANFDNLTRAIHTHKSTIIGIGNGTATRETESVLSDLISSGAFTPLDVKYCIVNESGASIYSVTDEAKNEMPDLDPNVRSAVSIARRLQDPLAEYVKIEPKHLGVGMYQHDVAETRLKTALDDVVVECVSFVGVDVNTGSEALLKKVSGLSAARAKNIIEWRTKNGSFLNREQLKSVKGIGPKSFEQCAGFIRVFSQKSDKLRVVIKPKSPSKKSKVKQKKSELSLISNKLDTTCIHPESYSTSSSFLDLMDESMDNIGSESLISKVKQYEERNSLEETAKKLNCGVPTLRLIIDGLSHSVGYDIRSEFQSPLFRKEVSSFNDLKPGMILTGRVTNIVHFGAFVDAGVGRNGLIHVSQMRGAKLQLGNRVEVNVMSVDVERGRLSLSFCRLL